MLERQIRSIKFPQLYGKFSYISCALDQTYVLVCMDYRPKLMHVSADGKVFFQQSYSRDFEKFGMLNERQVIVLDIAYSKIDIINLQTHAVSSIPHQFFFTGKADTRELYTFCDSKLFLVLERGGKNRNRFIFTYYNYRTVRETGQPVVRWDMQEDESALPSMVAKINNHSHIAMWAYQQGPQVSFTYCGLDKQGNIQTGKVKVENDLHIKYGTDGISLRVSNIWQTMPNTYMLVTQSNKNQYGDKCRDSNNIINNNYIIHASADESQFRIRQTNFVFGRDIYGVPFNDQLVNCFNLGTVSVFHTLGRISQDKYPIFYVHNRSQEIIAIEKEGNTMYSPIFFFPGWDDSTMIETELLNISKSNITFAISKACLKHTLKEISMFFLLHLEEDFDDDLLQDAIEILI